MLDRCGLTRMRAHRVAVLCLSLALLSVWGCSATLRRPSAKEYYEQASQSFQKEEYLDASDQYQELLDQYPLNPYAEEALLKTAYGHFMEENYVEAIAAFKDFERAYPTSPHMPFVKYFLGIANYIQIRSLDRDQAVTRRADSFFQEVIDRYPESAFVLQAEEKSKSARDILAKHELYVADFNHVRGNVGATKARLRGLIEQFSETDSTVMALDKLGQILNDEGNLELADLASRALAVRRNATDNGGDGSANAAVEADSDTSGAIIAGVDPLLLLVSELKKHEEAERLARTEADTKRLSAEKEAERKQRELDETLDDDFRSFEVDDNYQEVDLAALEQERQRERAQAALPGSDDMPLDDGREPAALEPSDFAALGEEALLSLDIDEGLELEDASAAGVLMEDEAGAPSAQPTERIETTDTDANGDTQPQAGSPGERDEPREVARSVAVGQRVESSRATAAGERPQDGRDPSTRDTVLGIPIEEIDFAFEDDESE